MRRRLQILAVVAGLSILTGPIALAADQARSTPSANSGQAGSGQAAAERQYRVARRLAAEGSAEAAAAMEKVIALDPAGELADDALVDLALLGGTAAWPEELGRLSPESSRQAASHLERVLTQHAGGDRAVEAHFLRALSRLEPTAGYDASAARLELLDIASHARGGVWDRRARYTRAWLDERQGNDDRALATYQRLLVDSPGSPCADRARLGQARVLLRRGDYARAARLLQEAIDRGVTDPTATALRELAVRTMLRRAGRLKESGAFETVVPASGVRLLVGMAAFPDGGVLLAGRREGVLRFGAAGEAAGRWELDQLQAVTVDAQGVAFAAAGNQVYRLDVGAQPLPIAGLGDFGPVSGLTVDGEGRFWLLDRRGDSVASLERGAAAPVVVWRVKGKRLSAIQWQGSRLVAVDTREQTILAIEGQGQSTPLASAVGERPDTVSADPTGRLAVLDPRSGSVVLIAADQSVSDSVSLKAAGIARAGAVVLGNDGRLNVFDSSSGAWLRTP